MEESVELTRCCLPIATTLSKQLFQLTSMCSKYHVRVTIIILLFSRNTIWDLRLKHLEKTVLKKWSDGFTIWNAGKQGRKLYRSLSPEFRARVKCFCDVDIKKIQQGFYIYENASERPKPKVPIVHFSKAQKPFVLCVKLGMTKGEFETNLDSLQLEEGLDYVHFN